MVVRANSRTDGIGGHLSTYASSASLYEVGFNHFFRGKDDGGAGRPGLLPGPRLAGHLRPGLRRGPADRGRSWTTSATRWAAAGLPSYPHPRLDARLLGVPDGVDGPRPAQRHLPGPRQPLPAPAARLVDTSGSRVWCFVGDGEMDEPETIGALGMAGREHLDNLIFVVNCNLQRLDGPVRGNGKIIQEFEALFRGAGWNVIKVIWGSRWDELLAHDVDGVLLNKMNTTVDGEFQKYATESGRLHPRALLRPRPPAAQAGGPPDRRGAADPAPGRPRLPQALRRLQAGHRARGRPDGHPGQDHQGLDARARDRGPQRHPPDQEDDQGPAAHPARPAVPARRDPRRGPRGRRSRPTTGRPRAPRPTST